MEEEKFIHAGVRKKRGKKHENNEMNDEQIKVYLLLLFHKVLKRKFKYTESEKSTER